MERQIILVLAGLLLLTVFVAAQGQQSKSRQTITVKITKKGFEPKVLSLQRDVPARIIFIRQTAQTCATEVSFPDYKINKPLPLKKPVSVEFTPTKEGELKFTCGMDMLRGKVIVQ
jgi:plastocyanin domain-containing protein